MSTTTNYHDALRFLPGRQARSKHQGILSTIRAMAAAVHAGHVAAGRYQELTSRGVTRDEAARMVFAEVYAAR